MNRLQLYGRHRDAANAADTATVAGNIASINALAPLATELAAIGANITELLAVYANEADIDIVAANIADINTVAANEGDIDTVAANIALITANAANIATVAANMVDVVAVAGNEADIDALAANMADINALATNLSILQQIAANMADINTVANADANIGIVVANMASIQAAALLAEYNDTELDFPSRDFRLDVSESVRATQSIVNGQVVSNVALLDKLHFGDGLMPVPANLAANITLTVQMSSAQSGANFNLRTNFYDASNTLVRQVDHPEFVAPNDTSEFTIGLPNSLLNTDISAATVGRVEIKRQAAAGTEHGGDLQVKRAVVAYV